jgi:hypothetical protein
MKQYKIQYMVHGNFQSHKIFSFENMPTKEECRIWLWNILNTYEKHILDWDLTIDDIEVTAVHEFMPTQSATCNVGENLNNSGICWVTKPSYDVKGGIPFPENKNDSMSC